MKSLFQNLVYTANDHSATILRLAVGLVILPHGCQKALGLFGGHGFSATVAGMTKMGLPLVIVLLVIAIEFLGSLMLIFGLFTRVAALGLIAVMLGAILTVHMKNGFFMNWAGSQSGEGFEYHILVIGICLALLVKGAGSASIDRMLSRT